MRSFLSILCIVLMATGCVQKTRKATVVYTLALPDSVTASTAGIRGSDQPLSWREDLALTRQPGDSVFRIAVTYETGYTYTEAKFTLQNDCAREEDFSRRIVFDKADTTYYRAVFGKQ